MPKSSGINIGWFMKTVVTVAAVAITGASSGHGASGAPIRIGATVSLSGKYAEPSLMIRDSYRLWEAQINRGPGLLGRPVDIVLYDDKSRRDLVEKHYRKLIEEDGVDIVLSPYGTPLTLIASRVAETHQMVMLASAASGSVIWNRGYRFVFGVYATADRYFIGLMDLMAREGFRSVSLLFDAASPFSEDVAAGTVEWARRFNLSISLHAGYQNAETELPRLLADVRARNADGLILAVYPQDGYLILNQLDSMSYRPSVLGMTIAPVHPDFHRKAGPIAENVFGPSQWEPDERIPFPGTLEFIAAFRRHTGQMPSYHAGAAYAVCQIIERAVDTTDTLDNHILRDYIAALDTVTVIGRFKVDHTGRQIGHNPILIQWQKGEKEIVYPTKMRTAAPRF